MQAPKVGMKHKPILLFKGVIDDWVSFFVLHNWEFLFIFDICNDILLTRCNESLIQQVITSLSKEFFLK